MTGWPRSLRAKLMGVVLLTTGVALGIALGAMVAYDVRAYHDSWIADMDAQAELLGLTVAPALTFDDAQVASENLSLLRARPQVRAAAVCGLGGRLFASYAAAATEARFPRATQADGTHTQGRELVVWKPVLLRGERVGSVYLLADYALRERVLGYQGIALVVGAVAMGVALLLSYRLQRIVTRPILAIGVAARDVVDRHDYSRRVDVSSDEEVGRLAQSFNHMMVEIESHARQNQAALREIEHEVKERRTAQQEVMRLNQDLERRVAERTGQLEASNRELALATDAAEKANRAKSEFLSSMSHELRTPLNAILGFAQLLSMQAAVLSDAKREEFTQHIVKAGRHLLNLISEILDLARIESANLMLSMEPVGLAEILHECRTLIGPAADQRRIRLLFPDALRLSVVADRTRLKQVLLNLLSNAIKYNRDGGSVLVECVARAPEHVAISVRDTGNGLRPEQLAMLFQPFNRLGQESGSVEGTGIGLVVTQRLVELMGGRIGVKSSVGEGSEFVIELRAAPDQPLTGPSEAESAFAPLAAAPVGDAAPLLLYVEDNPANLQLLREIVALRGNVRQMSAPDAQLGIELARAHAPSVILMDINLPGLSGKDALAILRADPQTAHIPVIALTANAMARDMAQGLAAGFFRYVTKPIDIARLDEAIDKALEAAAERPGDFGLSRQSEAPAKLRSAGGSPSARRRSARRRPVTR